MVDGLPAALGDIGSPSIADLGVATEDLANESVTIPKHAFVGTGSPTVWGNVVQFGNDTTGAGSTATVVFGTAFGGAPAITCVCTETTADRPITISGPTTTGFTAFSHGAASLDFSWMAIGSGAG